MSGPLSVWMQRLAASCHVALIALILVRDGLSSASLLAIPLLVAAPGLVRGHLYTYRWASMLLAFYAAGYLSAGYAEPQNKWSAFGMATLAALDFVGIVLYVRFLARERAAGAA